jgi:hypothetical protein
MANFLTEARECTQLVKGNSHSSQQLHHLEKLSQIDHYHNHLIFFSINSVLNLIQVLLSYCFEKVYNLHYQMCLYYISTIHGYLPLSYPIYPFSTRIGISNFNYYPAEAHRFHHCCPMRSIEGLYHPLKAIISHSTQLYHPIFDPKFLSIGNNISSLPSSLFFTIPPLL